MPSSSELSVSVITPSYNQASYIHDTIESVRKQTYNDVSHVVVDSASDDGTVDVLRNYPELTWVSEPDDGQADAVNKGIKMSDGDVVGWLNSDDPYVYKNTLETVVETFERENPDIVYGHGLLIDGENRPLRVMHVPNFDYEKLERHCYILQPAVFLRREVIEEHQLDTSFEYSIDYDLWLRLRNYDWHRVNRVLAADRNHGARKTIAGSEDARDETVRLRERRGIYDRGRFQLKQILDKVDWRFQRLKGIPFLYRLLNTLEDELALDIQKTPLPTAIISQIYRRKQQLTAPTNG